MSSEMYLPVLEKELVKRGLEPADDIRHYGVKGMKWGVRRYQPYQPGDKVEGGKFVGAVKSKAREVSMNRASKNAASMSDSEIISLTNRIRNENNLKRLAGSRRKARGGPSGSKEAADIKETYTKRAEMSDEKLQKTVQRLSMEENLYKQGSSTILTEQQKQLATSIVKQASKTALKDYVGEGVEDDDGNVGQGVGVIEIGKAAAKKAMFPKLDQEMEKLGREATTKYINENIVDKVDKKAAEDMYKESQSKPVSKTEFPKQTESQKQQVQDFLNKQINDQIKKEEKEKNK